MEMFSKEGWKMKPLRLLFVSVLVSVLVSGCSRGTGKTLPEKEVERISIGKIVDVELVPTQDNAYTVIRTEKVFLVVDKPICVELGKEVWIIKGCFGRQTFEWEGLFGKCNQRVMQ